MLYKHKIKPRKQNHFQKKTRENNAEKKTNKNRSKIRRQRRTPTTPIALHHTFFYLRHHLVRRSNNHHHHHHHSSATLRSIFLQTPTNRPLFPLKMEVEVKLRLPDSAAHQSLSSVLSPFLRRTHFQHNVFFDGANSELSALRAVLRLRFYGEDPQTAERCVSSLKAKAILVNGVSRVEEDEEDVDPFVGREIWANPNLIGSSDSRVLKRVKEEFGVKDESGYVCLGWFKNVRGVYEWKGLTLEVDETLFDFGTLYEIECESSEPDKAKEMIEELLKDNGIPYSCSKMSKFAIFRSGELPLAVSAIGEFKKANAPSDLVSKNGQPVSHKWMPPMTGVYKRNTDAAFFWNDIVGFGGIVRDSVGDALVTMSHCVRGSYEPDIAKALAARHALGITLEVGINIIMEIF